MDKRLTNSLSYILIGIAIGKINKTTNATKVLMVVLEDINNSSGNIPYDDLTAIVYNDVNFFGKSIGKDEFQEFTNDSMEFVEINDLEPEKKKAYKNYLQKINRHVSLAIIQRAFIQDVSLDVQKKIVSLEKELQTSTSKLESSEKELAEAKEKLDVVEAGLKKASRNLSKAEENLSETKGSMYTEFIAILGIFSALIFMLFGGFDAVSTTLIKISSNSSISELIVFTCIVIVPLLMLLYGLLYWVGKLSNRKISSCKCKSENCVCNAFERHKAFFAMLQMVATLLLMGLFGILLDEYPIKQGWWLAGQVFVVFVLLVGMIYSLQVSIFKKKTKETTDDKITPHT